MDSTLGVVELPSSELGARQDSPAEDGPNLQLVTAMHQKHALPLGTAEASGHSHHC